MCQSYVRVLICVMFSFLHLHVTDVKGNLIVVFYVLRISCNIVDLYTGTGEYVILQVMGVGMMAIVMPNVA